MPLVPVSRDNSRDLLLLSLLVIGLPLQTTGHHHSVISSPPALLPIPFLLFPRPVHTIQEIPSIPGLKLSTETDVSVLCWDPPIQKQNFPCFPSLMGIPKRHPFNQSLRSICCFQGYDS